MLFLTELDTVLLVTKNRCLFKCFNYFTFHCFCVFIRTRFSDIDIGTVNFL